MLASAYPTSAYPIPSSQAYIHTRTVRLFRNGANQALRIPKEFEFAANEAVLRREGEKLIIEPVIAPLFPVGSVGALAQSLQNMQDWSVVEEELPDPSEGLPALSEVEI